jgi:hypothetical protein
MVSLAGRGGGGRGEKKGGRSGAQQDRQVVDLLDREPAGDLARTAGDRRLDRGCGDHLVVEDDGELSADVLRGRLAEALRPADVEAEVDDGLVGAAVEGGLGVDQLAALGDDPALHGNALAARVLRGKHVHVGGALLADEAEFELRRAAQELLQALRVLEARHLDEDAVGPLALDARLRGAGHVDAAADDLDGLLDRAAHLLGHAGIGEGQRDQPVRRIGDLDVPVAGLAEDRVADRLGQLAQLGHDPLAVGGVRHADLRAPRRQLNAALGRHPIVAQDAADVVAQGRGLGPHQVRHVHFEQDVGAALQVEAEHDGAGGHEPGRNPARDRVLEGQALLAAHHARHREQQADDHDRHGGDDLRCREAQHPQLNLSQFSGSEPALLRGAPVSCPRP